MKLYGISKEELTINWKLLTIEESTWEESSLEILSELDKPGVITRDPFGVKMKLFLSLINLKGVWKFKPNKWKNL